MHSAPARSLARYGLDRVSFATSAVTVTAAMPKRLTRQQIDHFATRGYLSGIRILTGDECKTMLRRIERFERERPDDAQWAFDIKANLLFDWVYALGAHPKVLEVARDLLGPDIFNTNSVFRIKEPDSATRYDWHQDAARIQVDPPFVIAYVSITASTRSNGCLRVIPGSHARIEPFDVVENPDGQARRRVARTRRVDDSQAVDLVLGRGEMAVFSGQLIHGSGPNRSRARRVAILTDYTAAHACQSVGQGSGQLVSGEDRSGTIAHEPVPVGECTPLAVGERRRILNAYPENPLMGPLEPGQVVEFPDQPVPAHCE